MNGGNRRSLLLLASFLILASLLVALPLQTGDAVVIQKVRLVPVPVQAWVVERGIASWYGEPFQGRQTASGEIYDKNAWVMATRHLPLGRLRQGPLQRQGMRCPGDRSGPVYTGPEVRRIRGRGPVPGFPRAGSGRGRGGGLARSPARRGACGAHPRRLVIRRRPASRYIQRLALAIAQTKNVRIKK